MPNIPYTQFHEISDAAREQETARKADFKACPILADFIATMLQDLQYREADEACTEEREEGDTGTIYTLGDNVYAICKGLCEEFMTANAEAIEQALDLVPGEDGLQYSRGRYVTHERIGSTFYMLYVGHGISFTDDGDAPCLQAMNEYIRKLRGGEFYFDGERVYYM
jgi:hypothetical protein